MGHMQARRQHSSRSSSRGHFHLICKVSLQQEAAIAAGQPVSRGLVMHFSVGGRRVEGGEIYVGIENLMAELQKFCKTSLRSSLYPDSQIVYLEIVKCVFSKNKGGRLHKQHPVMEFRKWNLATLPFSNPGRIQMLLVISTEPSGGSALSLHLCPLPPAPYPESPVAFSYPVAPFSFHLEGFSAFLCHFGPRYF